MEATVTTSAMVNPTAEDDAKFREILSINDQINELRAKAMTLTYTIDDRALRSNAIMLMGLPDEYARKL